ncbi:hypothetical protein AB2B38_011300 [Balneola sp. MJW-20]|uniref:hypothetical protein n=1 Tax=Gracilimonas aurantiaca TaxID=3234185 RepID=UPI0034659CB3
MKKLLLPFILILAFSLTLHAQKRDDLVKPHEYSGPFVNTRALSVESGLANFFKNRVRMSHSYSMNFASMGNSFQNVNAYTNTLEFFFSEDLTGRVDVSFLHSPFGGSGMYGNNMSPQVMVRNAELNYRIGDNTRIQLQYQQQPRGFGYGRFGGFGNRFYGYDRYNPFY